MTPPEFRFEEWRKYAEEDREIAELALKENGPPNQICFHAQQMAEKYLKGFLVFSKKRFEKKHQLDYLLHLCESADPSFSELKEAVSFLTDFYIETRYPGDIPEFSSKDAQEAFHTSLRVREFVLKKVSKK